VAKKKQWDLLVFLSWTASVIERYGYASRKEDNPTYRVVLKYLEPQLGDRYPELTAKQTTRRNELHPKKRHVNLAAGAIAFAKALDLDDRDGQYWHNIHKVALSGSVTENVAGLAASIVHQYNEFRRKNRA